jgi:diguanylate cyclase (GGDEF)-like protein
MGDWIGVSEATKLSVDVCAQEPIHAPGTIQPHGLLVGLDLRTLGVLTKSVNVDSVLGATPLHETPPRLPPSVFEVCRDLGEGRSLDRVLMAVVVGIGLTEVHCFTASGIVFCEFEASAAEPIVSDAANTSLQTDDFVRRMGTANDMTTLSAMTAAAISAISGFERVLIYRFDPDGNGDVIGESLAPDWTQSFLGLRFPASDIPTQARELYRITSNRWIPTRDYHPVPLEPASDPSGQPFDLSLSRYRSVSPVHRMYQRNIGVDGAMSVSVMRDGALWGLVIGHQRKPYHVPVEIRRDIVGLVRAFALRLDALLNRETRADMERGMHACLAMMRKLAGVDDFLVALTKGKPEIIELIPGCSGAAMVWDDEANLACVRSVGRVSPNDDLIALAAWIRSSGEVPVFATDNLSQSFPPFSGHRETASGVLACFFNDPRHTVLLLFRPEVIQSVSWAGKPEKLVGPDGIPNLPRRSFDRWNEVKRGYSQPWLPWELDILATICATVNDVIIRQTRIAEELRKLSRTDPLTELANRRAFSEAAEIEFRRCKRFRSATAVLMIDVDHFKQVNDTYGHEAGDAALASLAAILKTTARATDFPARFGGEEFVVLLVGSDAMGSLEKAERIRKAVACNVVTSDSGSFCVTVSIGVSQFMMDDPNWSEAISRADKAMYRAKGQGRNKVVVDGEVEGRP